MKYEQISPTLNLLVFFLLLLFFIFFEVRKPLTGWLSGCCLLLAGYPGSTPEIKLLRGLIVSLLLVVSNRQHFKYCRPTKQGPRELLVTVVLIIGELIGQ